MKIAGILILILTCFTGMIAAQEASNRPVDHSVDIRAKYPSHLSEWDEFRHMGRRKMIEGKGIWEERSLKKEKDLSRFQVHPVEIIGH